MEQSQLDSFKIYRDYINKIGNMMPSAFETLSNQIHGIQKFRFLLALIMGTELIKIKLRGLIIFDDYINEMRWFLEKDGQYKIKRMNEYSSKSYGQTLREFSDRYNLENNNNELCEKLNELNSKRNNIIHDAVIEFGGDIEKVDEAIRPYILTQTLDYLQIELTKIINTRRETQTEIEKEMKEKGLL